MSNSSYSKIPAGKALKPRSSTDDGWGLGFCKTQEEVDQAIKAIKRQEELFKQVLAIYKETTEELFPKIPPQIRESSIGGPQDHTQPGWRFGQFKKFIQALEKRRKETVNPENKQ